MTAAEAQPKYADAPLGRVETISAATAAAFALALAALHVTAAACAGLNGDEAYYLWAMRAARPRALWLRHRARCVVEAE